MKMTKKNDVHVKMFLMEGSALWSAYEKQVKSIRVNDSGHNEGTICLLDG